VIDWRTNVEFLSELCQFASNLPSGFGLPEAAEISLVLELFHFLLSYLDCNCIPYGVRMVVENLNPRLKR
jgi:hypothetical protein